MSQDAKLLLAVGRNTILDGNGLIHQPSEWRMVPLANAECAEAEHTEDRLAASCEPKLERGGYLAGIS